MGRFRLTIKVYDSETIDLGGVRLSVLRLRERVASEESGDKVDAVLRAVERESRKPRGSYFEVEAEEGEHRIIMGESPRYPGSRMLFPRPARLLRVGVLRAGDLASRRSDGGGAALPADRISWHEPPGEFYVYESKVEAPGDVLLLIIDTDLGRRYLRLQRASTLRQSSRPRGRQGPPGGGGGPVSGGGSTPS